MFVSGNEGRLFGIKEDTTQFTAPVSNLPVYKTVTDMDGNTVQYVGKHKFTIVYLCEE